MGNSPRNSLRSNRSPRSSMRRSPRNSRRKSNIDLEAQESPKGEPESCLTTTRVALGVLVFAFVVVFALFSSGVIELGSSVEESHRRLAVGLDLGNNFELPT